LGRFDGLLASKAGSRLNLTEIFGQAWRTSYGKRKKGANLERMGTAAEALRVLLEPYYVARFSLAVSYLFVRLLFPGCAAQKQSSFVPGLTQEADIASFAIILLLRGARNAASVAELADTLALYGQLLAAALLYLTDFDAFLRFVAVLIAVAIVLPKPVVRCGSLVRWLTPLDVFRLLPRASAVPSKKAGDPAPPSSGEAARTTATGTKSTSSAPAAKPAAPKATAAVASSQPDPSRPRTILVVGRGGCDNLLATVCGIVRERREWLGGSDPVSFGYLDAKRYAAAATSDLGIDVGAFSLCVPSILEIVDGEVTRRLPPVAEDGAVTSVKLDAMGLKRYFRLEAQ
jgi:hypothetical protein